LRRSFFWVEDHPHLSGAVIRGGTQNPIAPGQCLFDTLLTPGATHAANRKLDLFHFRFLLFFRGGKFSLPSAKMF
jgi:hypothetical protein